MLMLLRREKQQTISLTDPLRPGKLKKTSGPFRCGICRSTVNSLAECLGYNVGMDVGGDVMGGAHGINDDCHGIEHRLPRWGRA